MISTPGPLQNQLLAALPAAELQQLRPLLEWVELPRSSMLHEAGKRFGHVHFPVTGVVSLVSSMADGSSSEIAVVGREGVVGVGAFMGDGVALVSAVVQCAGHGYRLAASSLREMSRRSEPLMQGLLRYTQRLIAQMAQTSACGRHHEVEQQLCRWLLLRLDRLPGVELAATHDRIGQLLGVRREGITMAALKLQHAGLIRYSRGRIRVLDRAGLARRCCECYTLVRSADERLAADPIVAAAHGPRSAAPAPARMVELA